MTQNRFYSSTTAAMQLTADPGPTGLTLTVNDSTKAASLDGNFPYTLAINWGASDQELVNVTARPTSTTFTVQRGQDGTAGVSHPVGATVTHDVSARDFNEAGAHVGAASGVHGLTGAVVGTTDVQTLSGKTLTAPTIASFVNANHAHVDAASGGLLALPNVPLPDDQGLIAWAYDPTSATSSAVLPTGQVQLLKVILRQPATITNIWTKTVGTAGSGLSNSFAGLYNSAGTRVALTADQSSALSSAGNKTMALTAPYSAAAGTYFVALLVGAATTAPTLNRSNNTDIINIGLSAGNYRSSTSGSGLTALPTSIALASAASGASTWWVGVS